MSGQEGAVTGGVGLLATDRLLIEGGNPDLAERIREVNCTCGHGPEPAEIHVWDCPYWDGNPSPSPCDSHDQPATPDPLRSTEGEGGGVDG